MSQVWVLVVWVRAGWAYLAESTSVEICSSWPIGVLSLLVVNDAISTSLALPYLVTKQRVAPSGEL